MGYVARNGCLQQKHHNVGTPTAGRLPSLEMGASKQSTCCTSLFYGRSGSCQRRGFSDKRHRRQIVACDFQPNPTPSTDAVAPNHAGCMQHIYCVGHQCILHLLLHFQPSIELDYSTLPHLQRPRSPMESAERHVQQFGHFTDLSGWIRDSVTHHDTCRHSPNDRLDGNDL